MNGGARAWIALATLLMLLGLAGWSSAHERFDWQPGLVGTQPWRTLTAVAVHYSAAHLAVNLAGSIVVAMLGWAARITPPMVWAWAAAWPLTQLGLLIEPRLLHYGGLSGVLHAGVAVAGLHLLLTGAKGPRRIGAACLVGLIAKVVSEAPWAPPEFHAGLGITVAPVAHACGVAAGLLCAGFAHMQRRGT
jgi:rhomboid family GlyGly-CTERM serine protease